MKHSRLSAFDEAIEEFSPVVQAVVAVAFAVVMWVAVFYAGSTLCAFFKEILP